MRWWLARFSFTLIILGGLLAYQGYKELNAPLRPPVWRVGLYFVGAGMAFGLGMMGVRARHRRDGEE